jgi:hypothetical protein
MPRQAALGKNWGFSDKIYTPETQEKDTFHLLKNEKCPILAQK